ncbi:MAG: tetratricopeptide repeat protein [Bacteroidia bacterium]
MKEKKHTVQKQHQKKGVSKSTSFNKLLLLPLIIITMVIYMKSMNNQFINTWDDHGYVSENPDITTLHGDSVGYTIKKTFSSYVLGNYHPITMLSYCMEYAKYKLNPKPYHVTNLVIHILNTLLVFFFIWLLTGQQWVAFITALLFGIHPMHVESVSWISERKDVLYTFFSLGALCTYIFYLKKESRKRLYYILTIALFLLALLSKAMAVSVAILFFAVDYFLERKINMKVILEKAPFILLSLIFGIVAIGAQKSAGAVEGIANYNFGDRILFSCYALMTYLWKVFLPINMSCYYNYPVKGANGMYPIGYYIAPVVIAVLGYLIFKSLKAGRDIVFGFGFFLISIALVLQILPVGDAIIADRFSYIPYIGIFFIMARWINDIIEGKNEKLTSLKLPLTGALIVFSIVCCYLTVKRTMVWKDSISLWSDAIEKYNKAPKSFNNRGLTYFERQQYDKALSDFNRTIQLEDTYPDAHYNRGVVYFTIKQYDKALEDYNTALQQTPKFAKAYNNRGNIYHLQGKYAQAIADYNAALEYNPKFGKVYCDRAGTYFTIGNYQSALADVTKAQQLGYKVDPRFVEAIQTGLNSSAQKQ